MVRAYELTRLKGKDLRASRKLLYTSGGVGVLLLAWLGLSVFGVLPDEYRVVNRRFVSPSVEGQLNRTVGLVAIGRADGRGEVSFTDFYTAAAISTDGFMLTSRQAAQAGLVSGMWVLLDGKRYEAQVAVVESLGDFALIKIDGDLPLKFKLSHMEKLTRLNQEVIVVGRQNLAQKIDAPVEWPVSVTRGTISRVFVDKLGTEWIEHSAAIGKGGGNGGPLILGDAIIGINIESDTGISRSISILSHRRRIYRAMAKWSQERVNKPGRGAPT